jgi:hypothetical protein
MYGRGKKFVTLCDKGWEVLKRQIFRDLIYERALIPYLPSYNEIFLLICRL